MSVFSWLGQSKTTYHSSPNSVSLKTKSGEEISLAKFCENTIPSCHLNPLLFNGHLQTAYTAVNRSDIPIYYKRKIFDAEDPKYTGTFAVDFLVRSPVTGDISLPPRTSYMTDQEFNQLGSLDNRPLLITLHGLSGGSHEIYLRHVLGQLIQKNSEWEALVINSRGCALSKITSHTLYNARATWDLRQLVKWLRERFPNRPLFALGFSLGANILTNYIGEESERCLLKAAVVCSNPWNLEISNRMLQRSWIGLEVYSKVMGTSMRRLFAQHEKEIMADPKTTINIEKVKNIKYLYQFDREVQCPTWGYPTEEAYYRDASSSDSLLAVRIPLLAINAEDDPIATKEAIPYGEFKYNPYTVLCATSLGGHLGWFQLDGGRWFAKAIAKFLHSMAHDINLDTLNPSSSATNGQVSMSSHISVFDPMRRKMHSLS